MKNLENVLNSKGFKLFLSMDCEGTIFDKNLEKNVSCLEKFLKLTSSKDIYTILFITPYFAEMLYKLNLVSKLKKYKVIFGLHIHPDNLPDEIINKCPFIKQPQSYISSYSYEEQKRVIEESLKYIENLGINPIEGFRGGYFSANDDTLKAVEEVTNIKWESHNIYRKEYKVKKSSLVSCPVYAFNDSIEFRLEDFDSANFADMIKKAILEDEKILGITHSYLLDEEDIHYKRDNISDSIYTTLEKISNMIEHYQLSAINKVDCESVK